MAYSAKIKQKAVKLRKHGFSVNEIVKKLGISKGTASVWLKSVILDKNALKRIDNIRVAAQFKAKRTRNRRQEKDKERLKIKTNELYSYLSLNKEFQKVICAILFWAEGSKNRSCVSFINSDPLMIDVYMKLLRASFDLYESKFRGLVHIHDYHDEKKTKLFWSNLSNIPLSQFSKSYRKPHTSNRKREGYRGCFRIRYYDSSIAKELYSIYTTLPDFLSGKIGS